VKSVPKVLPDMGGWNLKWKQEFNMPNKKPPPAPSTAAKPSTMPTTGKRASQTEPNPRQQPDNRWQRTKRYGWDSR
jgi:hypothetical protein